jgi:transposase-like protein
MRYPAVEKREIIRLVEQSALPARRTMAHLGILRSTFYRWCEQFRAGGPEALADKPSRPARVWNRIPDEIRSRIVDLALAETAAMLPWALLASGQITMGKVDGWQSLGEPITTSTIDLAA